MREVTAPTVSTPWEGKRTSSTSKTNAKAIKARPTQLGESEPAAKKKSNSAMPPVTPGKITPGCEISTYRPIRATTNKRKVTFGSCIRADIMILHYLLYQRYISSGGRRTSTESYNFFS